MMIASFQANLMSIHADTAEISTRWTDRQTAFQLYIVDFIAIYCLAATEFELRAKKKFSLTIQNGPLSMMNE